MEDINKHVKSMVEGLYSHWTWGGMKKDPLRKILLRPTQSRKIRSPGGFDFTFRHQEKDGDFRIFTKDRIGLIQWRSDPSKGDRLIYKPFDGTPNVTRTPVEDIFLDPSDIDQDSLDFFCVVYPEMARMAKEFSMALRLMDQELLIIGESDEKRKIK